MANQLPYLNEDDQEAAPPEDKDAIIQRYLMSKLGPQPEEDLESLHNKQGLNVQLQRDSAQANLMAGLNNASALISGGRYKVNNSDLEDSNKDRTAQIASSNKQMADAQQQSALDRKNAIAEYLAGKKQSENMAFNQKKLENDQRHQGVMEGLAAKGLDQKNEFQGQILDLKRQIAEGKNGHNAENDFTKLENEMSFGPTRGGQDFQKHKSIQSAADRILALGKQGESQPGGLDKRQIHEIAIASASLVGGSTSGAAQSTIEALVPHSMSGSAAGIEEWLSGNPTGTEQVEFVKRMLDTAKREKHIAGEKLKGYYANSLSARSKLADVDAGRYQHLKNKYLGADAQFDDNGAYVPKEYTEEPGHTDSVVYIQSPDGDIKAVKASAKQKYLSRGGKEVPNPGVATK